MVAQTDVVKPTEGRNTRIEYRMERMPFMEHPEAHIEELLNRVNELGKQGWHVVSVDLTYHPSYSPAAQPGMALPVLLEREPDGPAKRIEYRMERMPFMEHPEAHIEELLSKVNELGKQGWRVVSVDLTYHPSYSPAAQPGIPLPVLLERELKV